MTVLDHPKPVVGATVQSRTRFVNDDPEAHYRTPLHGHVYTTEPAVDENGVAWWPAIGLVNGQPTVTWLEEADIDWDAYSGLINPRAINGLIKAMATAEVRGRKPHKDWLLARLAFSPIAGVRS